MTDIEEFVDIVRDEIGLPVTVEDLGRDFDQVTGWDSVYLLNLLIVLERHTGRRISLPDVLDATSLRDLYTVVVGRAG